MVSNMMKDVLQKLQKKEDLWLVTTRNCRVLSRIGRLLGVMEDSDKDSTTRALNLFALLLGAVGRLTAVQYSATASAVPLKYDSIIW